MKEIIFTLIIATLILFIIFKLFSSNKYGQSENSLDSKKKGKTIIITGPTKSGKTLLFQKLADAPKLLKTAHSLRTNSTQIGKWKLVDLPLDNQELHSQPANFFHFNDLAALILCFNDDGKNLTLESKEDLDLVIIMTVAVGILKNVPLCLVSDTLEAGTIIEKLVKSLGNLQNSRASLVSEPRAISFDDPINRLIFESDEGEVSGEYESQVRDYFDNNVTITTDVKDWIESRV